MIQYDKADDTFFITSRTGLNIKDDCIGIIFDSENKLVMNYGLGFAVEKKYKELCKIAKTDPIINQIIKDYECFIFPNTGEDKEKQLETLEVITNSKEKSQIFINYLIQEENEILINYL